MTPPYAGGLYMSSQVSFQERSGGEPTQARRGDDASREARTGPRAEGRRRSLESEKGETPLSPGAAGMPSCTPDLQDCGSKSVLS